MLIDTEHERARFYADRSDLQTGTFLYASMDPPYSPDKYKEYVQDAALAVGPDGCVIVDSFSHVWNNEGGVLDIKDRIAQQAGKNSYTAWNEAGKEQNSLVNTILSVNCHTIVTMRSKMAYALEENERGRMQPVKMGLSPVQRDDTEYEFDIVLDIARNHIATASKDTTFLDKFGQVITPELGRQLREWLDNGVEPDFCTDCGKVITSTQKYTAAELVEKSVNKFKIKLCYKCMKARLKADAAQRVPDGANNPDA